MKVASLHLNVSQHQQFYGLAMKAGLEEHGWSVVELPYDELPAVPCDMVIMWGWKQASVRLAAKAVGVPIMVMEAAHVGPRLAMASVGFDGLAGRGRYPHFEDNGSRWNKHFPYALKLPAKLNGGAPALLIGQVRGDIAIQQVDFEGWAQSVTSDLIAEGRQVIYRPHPNMLLGGDKWAPNGVLHVSRQSLEADFNRCSSVITYNSTTGVEAVLRGLPTVACDQGSMAWPVASHIVTKPVIANLEDRKRWAHRMAWTQWRHDEIASGEAWEALQTCVGL